MNTPKSKVKPLPSLPASQNGKQVNSMGQQQMEFASLIASVAKRYGVKVASAAAPSDNPYAMSAEKAA